MGRHYRPRRDILARGLRTNLGELLDENGSEAGVQLLARPPGGVDDRQAIEPAAAAGICVLPVTAFCREPNPRNGLIFGFASSNDEKLRRGVHAPDTVL